MGKSLVRIFSFLCVSFLFVASGMSIHAEIDDFDDDSFRDAWDMFGADDVDYPDWADDDVDTSEVRSVSLSDEALIFADNGLTEPIWSRTYVPRGRDVLYSIPPRLTMKRKPYAEIHTFFNKTNALPITVGQTFNLVFATPQKEQKFFDLLKGSGVDETAEVGALLPFIKRITVEERKLGMLLEGGWLCGPFFIQLDSSLLLSERNLFTNKNDEREIRALIEKMFPGQPFTVDLKKEFARIRIGLGDARLRAGVKAYDYDEIESLMGVSLILPTASGVFLDGHFKAAEPATVTDFGALLENARTLMLKPELGNNGHVALGFFWDGKMNVFKKRGELWARFSFDNFFSAWEKRLVMFKQRVTAQQVKDKELARDDLSGAGAPAEEIAAADAELALVLSQFKEQFLAPTQIEAKVDPGNVFMVSLGGNWKWGRGKVGFGYDLYLRGREEFERVRGDKAALGSLRSAVDSSDLNVANAVSPYAVAHKVFFGGDYNVKLKRSHVSIALGSDVTFKRHNMGKDWTVYSKLKWLF